MEGIVGIVLAAGSGTRLRPLTRLRPKPLCPVGDVPLVDLALERLKGAVDEIAVNVHHGREALDAHLGERVHLSHEEEQALGTGGALGFLRPWIAGRPALVVNADAWCPGSLTDFARDWDGERIRLLLAGDDELQPHSGICAALMPWSAVKRIPARPVGLYEASWGKAAADGDLDVVRHDGPFIDCGTPAQYLAANLAASNGASVIGEGATVEGEVVRSVVWPGMVVRREERLVDAIRADWHVTVLVR
jgi:NDP-sugar pyrophosphorylase family protein